MFRTVTFFLILTILCFSSSTQPPNDEKINLSRTHFNDGVKKGIDQEFESAIAGFEMAIELNPLFAEAFLYKGLAEIEMQNFDQAIKDFTITIELDPSFTDQAHYFRGLAYYFKNENELAIDDFSVAILMNPDFVSFYQRGKASLKIKEFRRALQDFDIALRLKEDFYEANLYRGINLYYLEMYDAALQDLEIATTWLPHSADAHYYKGLSKIALNNNSAGIEDLDRVLQLDPGYTQAAQAREEVLASNARPSRRNNQRVSMQTRQTVAGQNHDNQQQSSVADRKVESTDINFSELFSASRFAETSDEAISEVIGVPESQALHAALPQRDTPSKNDQSVLVENISSSKPVYNSIEDAQPGFYNKSLESNPLTGFGVQVASYSNTNNLLSLADAYSERYTLPVFFNIAIVNGRKLYKLIIGQFNSREEAEGFRDKLRNESFPDSFLVVFENL